MPPAAETACVFPLRHGMCGEGFSDLMCSLRRVIQKKITHDFYDTKAFFSAVAGERRFFRMQKEKGEGRPDTKIYRTILMVR